MSAPFGNVVMVSPVLPVPADSGKKVVLSGLLDYWVDRVGAARVHLVLVGSDPTVEEVRGVAVHHVGRPSRVRQLLTVATLTAAGRRSLQEAAFWSPRVARRVEEAVRRIGPDLVVYDTIRMAQLAPEQPTTAARRVVYLDDLFSVRYGRMLELMRRHPDVDLNPLGDFGQHLPAAARAVAAHPRVSRLLLSWERRLTARRERRTADRFEAVLLISPEEVRSLSATRPGARVLELPPTIPTPVLPVAPPAGGPPVFVLMGLLTLAHNLDAAEVFLDQCLPSLLDAVPDVQVHVVGRGAPPSLLERAARYPGVVHVEGFVPDLDALLGRATALVMPLRFGSGIKIKLLEALGRGLPVVTTPVGAEGVETGPGTGLVVEEEPSRFTPHLVALLEPTRRSELARAARSHFDRRYAADAAHALYDAAFAPAAVAR